MRAAILAMAALKAGSGGGGVRTTQPIGAASLSAAAISDGLLTAWQAGDPTALLGSSAGAGLQVLGLQTAFADGEQYAYGNGSTTPLDLRFTLSLTGLNAYTIVAHALSQSTATQAVLELGSGTSTPWNQGALQFRSESNKLRYECQSNGSIVAVNAPGAFSTNTRYALAGRFGGGSADLFVDGAKVATVTKTGAVGHVPGGAGGANRCGVGVSTQFGSRLNGRVWCAYVFSRALSDAEIAALHLNPWQVYA